MKRSKARHGYARYSIGRLRGSKALADRIVLLRETTGASAAAIVRFALNNVTDEEILANSDTVRAS